MRILLIALFVISIMGCEENEFKTYDNPYRISKAKGNNMKKYKNDCTGASCKNGVIVNRRMDVFNQIVADYPDATVSWVDARYRRTDEDHYCRINSCTVGDKKSKVRGYSTQIVQVTPKTKSVDPIYFDIVEICPPPESETSPGTCAEPPLLPDTTSNPPDTTKKN